MSAIYPVIHCGCSGARLLLAPRADLPKHLLKLIGDYFSLQDTGSPAAGCVEVVIVRY